MERYWKDGFYDSEVDGGIEITEEYYYELLNGQSAGKMIVEDDTGYPILIDTPKPTEEENNIKCIAQLKAYLTSTDWCVIKSLELGVDMQVLYPDVYAKREAARIEINELETLIK